MKTRKSQKKMMFLVILCIGSLLLLLLTIIRDNILERKTLLWIDPLYSDASELPNDTTLPFEKLPGTFTVADFTYTILNSTDKTASITGIQPNSSTTELTIPDTVTYEGTVYTISEINFNNKYEQYPKIKTITIPASVTGKVLITGTKQKNLLQEDNNSLERPYLVPFPNLEKMIFLGISAPKSIDVFSYLSYDDMIYQVPIGSEASYEAASIKSFSQPVLSHYDWDGDHTYNDYKVAPVVVSEAQNNPEPHLFQTKKGVYLVTDSAADGKGTAALIKAKELVRQYNYKTPNSGRFVYPQWDDFTIESEAVFGSYRYTVTTMKSGALLDFRKLTMLTIPDTIFEMEKDCIYAGDFLNFVFFSKNCKTISDNIFNGGENGVQNGILFYVPSGVTKLEGTFQFFKINQIYLPKGIAVPKNLTKACDNIVYHNGTRSSVNSFIKISTNNITANIGSKKKITAVNGNSKLKDTIHFINSDLSVAAVTDTGNITPKHKGTSYVVAFSEVTGAHQLLQLKVLDTIFQKGIFTYRLNYSKGPEVTIVSCEPSKSQKVLTIPSSVEYKGKKYTITQVCAGDYTIDEFNWYSYTVKAGFPRVYDTLLPLIPDSLAKDCNITEVVLPSTIKRTVSSLGNLSKLKKIVFKGTSAPALIAFSDQNYETSAIYVPAKALSAYKKTTWRTGDYDNFAYYNGYSVKSKIKLKTK